MYGWQDIVRHYLNLTAKDGASLNWSWQRCKREFFKIVPKVCACCGSKKRIEVHHKKPRHLFPELAWVMDNLIALCGGGRGCHFHIGHLNSYRTYNAMIDKVCSFVRRFSIKKRNAA